MTVDPLTARPDLRDRVTAEVGEARYDRSVEIRSPGLDLANAPAEGPGDPGTVVARFEPAAAGHADAAVPAKAATSTGGAR